MQKRFPTVLLALLLIGVAIWLYKTYAGGSRHDATGSTEQRDAARTKSQQAEKQMIDELTGENIVVNYVRQNGALPAYYISKKEARNGGWKPSAGNLCEVLPGKAIGGDVFTNREKKLPIKRGRTYYEADLNYNCGRRNADRLVFSTDGLIFVSYDHYQTFQKR